MLAAHVQSAANDADADRSETRTNRNIMMSRCASLSQNDKSMAQNNIPNTSGIENIFRRDKPPNGRHLLCGKS
jgi:hypothetical protein